MNIINGLYFIYIFISALLPALRGKLWWNMLSTFIQTNLCCLLAELSKNLHYYESIHADDVVHRVVKRGTKQSYHPFNVIKEVEFKALGRHFRIILHPQRDVLHSNFKAYSVDGEGNEKVVHFGKSRVTKVLLQMTHCASFPDHESLYSGRVFGESESSVRAHIVDKMITANIVLPDETYHIEVRNLC